jgi:type II secretory pathway predicted ATPase ExeA
MRMTILTKRRPHLQSLGLPSDVEMIRRTRAFVLRAGLTMLEMATISNLNPNSLRVFLSGHYDSHHRTDSNTLAVRAALKQVMDLYEIENLPPSDGPHHSTAEYEAMRRSMLAALRNGTAFLVDGPPGTQKSYTFRRVADEINLAKEGRAVYIYARVDHSPASFLVEACTEAGIPNRGNIDQLIRKLRFFLGNRRTVLIVDEAQHLGVPGLEVLRQLLDQPPFFGVVLGGSHDLSLRLRDWRMEQWRSRLRRTHLLTGLTTGEAERILAAELGAMQPDDIADTIRDATVEAVRNKKTFQYISARNLFFAIQDALHQVKEKAPVESAAEPEVSQVG